MTYSIKVKFAEHYEIEVSGDNTGALTKLINEATKKFFPNTKWIEQEMKN